MQPPEPKSLRITQKAWGSASGKIKKNLRGGLESKSKGYPINLVEIIIRLTAHYPRITFVMRRVLSPCSSIRGPIGGVGLMVPPYCLLGRRTKVAEPHPSVCGIRNAAKPE